MTLKICTIVGARPQFVKASAISRELHNHSKQVSEVIVHTGQHYDYGMSQVFFEELNIPEPAYNLSVAGLSHGEMTGRMLAGIEKVLLEEAPDWVLIYGDTNSTLAGALAAAKLHIPVAHVEAGLRSFNMRMPEEVNRIVADRVSTLLFTPSSVADQNLANEGIVNGVHNVGDVMFDVAEYYSQFKKPGDSVMQSLGIAEGEYALATCHRAENTDSPEKLRGILEALSGISAEIPVVFPVHPRTRNKIKEFGCLDLVENLILVEPLSFLEMLRMEKAAKVILTDSGGVQKEAFFFKVPCITMREETEWVETVELGWNTITGSSSEAILNAYSGIAETSNRLEGAPYGSADAAQKIVKRLIA